MDERDHTVDAPSGTVTFLFTDIEGSTRLLEQLHEQYAQVLEEQRQILRAAFARWHGQEVDTQGDAFFVAFDRATEAVSCAVDAQHSLAEHAWPEGVRLRVRMGLHTGEPVLTCSGYTGMDVHRAARIVSSGHGGQILLSDATRILVEPVLPEGTSLRDLGKYRLKDLERAEGIYQLIVPGLQADFPPLNSSGVTPKNLPIQLTSFIGREQEIEEVKRQEWTAILQGELEKAQEIQRQFAGVGYREVEQAVLATFLHSQPIGQKALTRELLLLTGHTRPDKIELEKALRRWADTSWFLDEAATQEAETTPDGTKSLPKSWRLGSRPNLRQMHHDACQYRVPPELVSAKLLEEIQKLKSLTAGASAAGARVHNLPDKPSDIEDDGEFHYGVLGPKSACDPGKPSPEARRFLEETTGPDRPRVYRNAVILAVPSKDGLEMARSRIVDYLGWEEVRSQLKTQELDLLREQMLAANLEQSRKGVPEAIRQAYAIVMMVSEKNDIQAFKVTIGNDPLFKIIKDDIHSRIQDTAISADALLPGGPYDLWREGETARRLKDLEGAFAQFPHLPKMLNRKAIHDTLIDGCVEGILVLHLARPDKTFRTFWRQRPDDMVIKEPALEVVLPENAVLSEIPAGLIASNTLPGLWDQPTIRLKDVLDYFSGGQVVKVQKQGYEEPLTIPKAERNVIIAAVSEAVKDGQLWLTSGPASIWAEEIPAGLLSDDVVLQAPPPVISSMDVLPPSLPDAWQGETTSALSISAALSDKAGQNLPWRRVREAIDGAYRARYLETTIDSGTWPCEYPGAQTVKLRVLSKDTSAVPVVLPSLPVTPTKPGVRVAEVDLRPNEIQDLADVMGELTATAAGNELKFHLRIELGGAAPASEEVVKKVNAVLEKSIGKLEVK